MKQHPWVHAILATLLFCFATFAYTSHMPDYERFLRGENDFLPRYVQARMATSTEQFDIEEGYRQQQAIAHIAISGAYNDRLPWQALLLRPLTLLPYRTALYFWVVLNLLCFAALVRYWLLPQDLVIWGIVFLPAAAALIVGQEAAAITLCAAAVLLCAKSGRDTAAGLLLALCTVKPHLFVLVPVVLIAQRRWRILASCSLATAGLLILSTVLAGWRWVPNLFALWSRLGNETSYTAQRPSIFQFGDNSITIAAACLIAALFVVLVWRARSFETGFSLAVIGGILIAAHTSIYDLPLLLVAVPGLHLKGYRNWLQVALFTPLAYWGLLNGPPWNHVLPALLAAAAIAAAAAPALSVESEAQPRSVSV